MQISVLKSKLHRATVTGADLNYEGSISICPMLRKEAQLYEHEKVDIYNINNGARFSTYIIPGKEGEICLNGAAARHVHYGDKVIIASYCSIDVKDVDTHEPTVVLLNDNNKPKET